MLKIREYQSREEIEADYENYASKWVYDAKTQRGEHESGLRLSRKVLDREVLTYENLPEWEAKQRQEGLSDEDILKYRRCLKNQFIIMYEKNPYQKQYTWEDLDKDMEAVKRRHILKIDWSRENGVSDVELQEMAQKWITSHKEYYKMRIKKYCEKVGKCEDEETQIMNVFDKKYDKMFGER